MGPIAAAGVEIGMGLVNNAANLAFGGARQKQELKGQKKSLEQQNAASMDIWNKTNYGPQVEKMKEAGLNPALMYGMGGGGGGSTGSAAGGGVGGAGLPQPMMDVQGLTQILKLQAEKDLLREQAAATSAAADVSRATVPKLQQDTKTGAEQEQNVAADTAGQLIKNETAKIEQSILDSTQWYHIGKIEQDWLKATQEYRSAAAKANVDENTQETQIKQERENLAITILQQKVMKMGMKLTEAQINNLEGMMKAALMNADTNKWNAESGARGQNTNENRLSWDKQMHNVPDDLKLLTETIQDIAQALALKGIAGGGASSGGKK